MVVMNIMQSMMFGPPLVGKSSLLSRLIGVALSVLMGTYMGAATHMVDTSATSLPLPSLIDPDSSGAEFTTHSTGVANKALQVIAKKPKFVLAQAAEPGAKWELLQIDLEAINLIKHMMSLPKPAISREATQVVAANSRKEVQEESTNVPKGESTKVPNGDFAGKLFVQHKPRSSRFKKPGRKFGKRPESNEIDGLANIDKPEESNQSENLAAEIFKNALRNKQWKTAQAILEDSFTIYFTDTGGQPEFQEVLPALTSGPSVFFLVFRVCDSLNENYCVEYVRKNSERSIPYKTSFTLKEVLMQSLASISSICSYSSRNDKTVVILEPKVILVGTHKDKASEEHIQQIQKELKDTIQGTDYFKKGIIEFNSPEEPVIVVNNHSDDDADFQKIRSKIEKIAKLGSYRVSTPAPWFVLGLALRNSPESVVSMEKCLSVALECGLSDEEEVREALWFLHTKLGLLRYFGEIEELSSIVICDPQLLFDKVTNLLTSSFTFAETGDVYGEERFKNVGLVSKSLIEKILAADDSILSCRQLLLLLEHLDIVAPIRNEANELKDYFVPSVLNHAPIASMCSSASCSIPALLVLFECGYVPKGLFGALAVQLLSNKSSPRNVVWKLWEKGIARNTVPFFVGSEHHVVTLQHCMTHLEVGIQSPPTVEASSQLLNKNPEIACDHIRQTVSKCLTAAFQSLHYNLDQSFSFGFYCNCQQGEKHIAKCTTDDDPHVFTCSLYDLPRDLSEYNLVWFGHPLKVHNDSYLFIKIILS